MNKIIISSILAVILLSTSLTISFVNADTGKKPIASFVDPKKDPQSYVKRYQSEPTYKDWFDKNYPNRTIYDAVGLPNPSQTKVPDWVRNTALWHGQGKISDADFVSAIQFLINKGIMKINPQVDNEYKQWAENEFLSYQEQIDYLKLEIERIETDNHNMKIKLQETQQRVESTQQMSKYFQKQQEQELNRKIDEFNTILTEEERKPLTSIVDQKVNWRVADSKGNLYYWEMPIDAYESLVTSDTSLEYLNLEMPDGTTVEVVDHTKFVGKSFTKVIDEVYENSDSDSDFIYEIWYITSQLTTYSYDIGEYPRYALETLSRGGGDCEDTAILIADMIHSSKHTSNWTIQLVYLDSDHPKQAQEINHVIVSVDTGKNSYKIESTAKDESTMNEWADVDLFGWWIDI